MRERERVCVCERERVCVREREFVCVCVRERERASVCLWERERRESASQGHPQFYEDAPASVRLADYC